MITTDGIDTAPSVAASVESRIYTHGRAPGCPPHQLGDLGVWPRIRDVLGRSPTLTTCAASLLILLLGIVDWASGPDIAFSVFYLVPLAAVAWTSGPSRWMPTAILAATTWLAADLASGARFSTPLIPLWNMTTRLAVFIVVATLLSHLCRAMEHEQELARVDALTGVANGRWFSQEAATAVRDATDTDAVTLLYLDLDDFKAINDRHGHSEGDEVLRRVGAALREAVRAEDLVGRLGGDEFAVVLRGVPARDAEAAVTAIVQRVEDSLAASFPPVHFSAGAVTFAPAPANVDVAIDAADSLMYEMKRAGKHRVVHRLHHRDQRGGSAPERS